MIKKISYSFGALFIVTGILIIIADADPTTTSGAFITSFISPIFGIHMAGWMILGMMSNYLWDLFNEGKGVQDIHLPDLFKPILVAPIVFFSIWSMWPADHTIMFSLNLIAFQNGFFWQVILSKAAPVIKKE